MENKVAKKAIETIDLTQFLSVNQLKGFDIKPFLFKELVLKEKEFREQLQTFDFSSLSNSCVFVHCSSNAIIPMWAFMLLASYLTENKINFIFAPNLQEAYSLFLLKKLEELDMQPYQNKRVVVKGCGGQLQISPEVFMVLTKKLKPLVKALSFGEACSMVPLFKN